jgi:hypothetical protein
VEGKFFIVMLRSFESQIFFGTTNKQPSPTIFFYLISTYAVMEEVVHAEFVETQTDQSRAGAVTRALARAQAHQG